MLIDIIVIEMMIFIKTYIFLKTTLTVTEAIKLLCNFKGTEVKNKYLCYNVNPYYHNRVDEFKKNF